MQTLLIYSGRFQPFCKHHYMAYKWAINQFGKDNCYIATSNVTNFPKSPFDFNEKKEIIKQYGINDNKIIQVENPYNCKELLKSFDKNNTVIVYLIGDKDKNRFKITSDSYYQWYNQYNKNLESYPNHSYIVLAPYVSLKTPFNTEYSGTNVRDELCKIIGNNEISEENKELFFDELMGWHDDNTYKMICNKINELVKIKNENKAFTKEWWNKQLITSILNENLICENGAGGHIQHVFDVPWVHTGKDIIKCFNKIIDSLQHKAGSLKLDGINISLKIVNNQFVIDRGSNKERDVNGISIDNVDDYINNNPILNSAIKTTLSIFNTSLNDCKTELQQLGVLDNSKILLNCEYINGKTNIIDYGDKKIIAIHGLLKEENINNRRDFVGTSYDEKIMNAFIEKINKIANKYKFHVVGNIKCELVDIPNLDSIMTTNVSIYYNDKKTVTKQLYGWLSTMDEIPLNKSFKTINNKTIPCVSQNVLITLLNKTKLSEYVADEDMYQYVINGYITYLAEIMLGQSILDKIKSAFVISNTIEGIVVNDKNISTNPIKITGDFILKTSLKNKK